METEDEIKRLTREASEAARSRPDQQRHWVARDGRWVPATDEGKPMRTRVPLREEVRLGIIAAHQPGASASQVARLMGLTQVVVTRVWREAGLLGATPDPDATVPPSPDS